MDAVSVGVPVTVPDCVWLELDVWLRVRDAEGVAPWLGDALVDGVAVELRVVL